MTLNSITRRSFLGSSAGVAASAVLAGAPMMSSVASAATGAPFPTLAQGRISPQPARDYVDSMLSGGPGKDGIPSIDKPSFWSMTKASEFLDDGDIVFGLVQNDTVRAYPQRILVWHEIVNDVVDGKGLAITYCPLTGTAIAFERGSTEFGVSGRLVNSNLIMYDRDTDTWFPQILAVGTQGPHTGKALVERPLVWTTWGRWRALYPQTEVLSTRTGALRNYRRDPYGAYNDVDGYYLPESNLLFPLMNESSQHPAKSMFLLARTAQNSVAFDLNQLRQKNRLELISNGIFFTAVYDPRLDTGHVFRGRTLAEPIITGASAFDISWSDGVRLEPLSAFQAMWFAVAAYYPEVTVHV